MAKRRIVMLVGSLGLLLFMQGAVEGQRSEWASEWATIGEPLELMERDVFPGNEFTFARIQYTFRRRGRFGRSGHLGDLQDASNGVLLRGFWATDYPEADENFSLRLSQITTLNVSRKEDGSFKHVIVRLDEGALFKYPFIYTCNVGFMDLTEPEQEGLRAYLLRGGFLMVDDFWGDGPRENLEYQMSQVLPPEEYPLVKVPLDHAIFHMVFDVKEVPQVPDVGSFYASGGSDINYWPPRPSYARYGYGATCWGIFDKNGRLMVVAFHNSDMGDGWEREGQNYEYFRAFSAPMAYPMGINIVVYAMTH